MGEQLILDPPEEIANRVALPLHDGAIKVGPEGPDFGDSQIEQYLAKQRIGSIPVDSSLPNRQPRIPLVIDDSGGGLRAARAALQNKVARIQQEGGVLKREMVDGATYYLDVISATIQFGAKNAAAWGFVDADAVLALEAIPDYYGPEDEYDTLTATGTLAQTLKKGGVTAVVPGDYPGRTRWEVTDTSGNDQLGLLFGVRSRHYSSAATAAVKYAAQSLTPLDTAANATVASTACVRHQNLSTGWTPVLGTNLTAGTFLTHTGSYRVWARVYSTSAVLPKLRLVYDVGDLTLPAENKAVQIPGASNFYLVDLGEIRLDPVSAGTHRWQGVVQSKGAAGGENVAVAEVEFQPLDESAGRLTAPASLAIPLAGYAARDEFNQSAGNLAGKTAPVGGTWSGAGVATDLTVDTATKTAQRSTFNDIGDRLDRLGTGTATLVVVQADITYFQVEYTTHRTGIFARYVDASNHLIALVASGGSLRVSKRIAGVETLLASVSVPLQSAKSFTIRLYCDKYGNWTCWHGSAGDPIPLLKGQDSDLATGGTLATGGYGILDLGIAGFGAASTTRSYDNFAVWVPTLDAVLVASQSAELATDGMVREDATGTAYGPVSDVRGDLPRIPSSGAEGRPVELFLRSSRGDLDKLPDSALDGISVKPYVRPSWLQIPGA